MTYSIIGHDPATGEIGVGVQSRFFAAGRIVPWLEAGVGAIASQAFASPHYGSKGLDLLRQGGAPSEALDTLRKEDDNPALRQVAIMNAEGHVAVHTGARCVAAAGHAIGAHCVAQANMMARDTVWGVMIAAFERSEGALPDRILAALQAAEDEGGDIRGAQAAALIVVGSQSTGETQAGRLIDLRIDDHPAPIAEIARLLRYSRAHQKVMSAMARLGADAAGALSDIDAALSAFPNEGEFLGRRVMALMANGRFPEAQATLAEAQKLNPNAREFMLRLADTGVIPVGRDVLAQMFPA